VTEPGDSLALFRLVEYLSEGDRWRAVDTRDDREVAIKILPTAFANNPESLARFKETARAIAALDHPNIVAIDAVAESGGVHFVSMKLVRGETLAQQLPQKGLPPEKLVGLALPLVDALRAAHEQGLTHRYLTPHNVILTEDGRPMILDFGMAEVRESELDPDVDPDDVPTLTLTQAGARSTLPYMSPEQIYRKPLDHRSDLFSLGTVLYEMATGKQPFVGESSADVAVAVLKDQPPPVAELNPALPERLALVIGRALEKDRGRRFQTAQELHDELAKLGAG
jgi:serine/threonine protein kinase